MRVELERGKSSGLTGADVDHAGGQVLVGVQVHGDERCVFALDVTGLTGLDSIQLVPPPQT